MRSWKARNPAKTKAYDALMFQRHKTKAQARNRAYAETHKEQMSAYRKKWQEANRVRYQSARNDVQANRRARRRANGYEPIERIVVWAGSNGRCFCGDTVSFYSMELDHIVPLSKGGPHLYSNVRASHADCNRSKRDRQEIQ